MTKVKYRFNPESLNYYKVESTIGQKLKRFLTCFSASVFAAIIYYVIFASFFDSPLPASNMAVQTFNKYLTGNFPGEKLYEVLRNATLAANQSITETVTETPALRGMGCTLVAALLKDRHLYWVSVGDSHLYLLRKKQLVKKNANHSYGGFLDRMAAAGKPVEAEAGFSRNMLMSALTGDEIADIDCPETPLELEAGDRIVISSDGLDSINTAKIVSFAENAKNAKEYAGALLKGVQDAAIPRQDNTTVVVIDVNSKEAKAAPAAAPAKVAIEPEKI